MRCTPAATIASASALRVRVRGADAVLGVRRPSRASGRRRPRREVADERAVAQLGIGDGAGRRSGGRGRARASAAAPTSSFCVDAAASGPPPVDAATAPSAPSTATQPGVRRERIAEVARSVARCDRRVRTAPGTRRGDQSGVRGDGARSLRRWRPRAGCRARGQHHDTTHPRPRARPRGPGAPPRSRAAVALAEPGVLPEVPERGHRAVRARVAEASGRAHRRGARVVGRGDRELGRGEDRLAGRVGDLGGGLREPRVLALVVRDDAFEAVVGIEAAVAQRARRFDWMPRPRYTIASISGWRATSSITSGSCRGSRRPRSRSGCCGSSAAAASRRSRRAGRRAARRARGRRSRAIASAVTTPQPPAVVSTAVRGPAGSGWVANVAAASNASSTVVARVMPAWRHMPSKMRSSAASVPVWLAAARWPPAVVPPLTSTTGLRRATVARAARRARGRRRRLRRTRGSPRSRRRRRTSRGSRRRRPRPRCPRSPPGSRRRRSAPPSSRTTTRSCPTGSRSRSGPAAGTGATICAHSCAGVDTTPWPFGPASRMPSSSASATSSRFGRAARRRPPRRSPRS